MWAATNAEIASLGCAPSSGFLSLLTVYSALNLTALFHAESVLGVEALRGFPLPVAAAAFAALCPRVRKATLVRRNIRHVPENATSISTI